MKMSARKMFLIPALVSTKSATNNMPPSTSAALASASFVESDERDAIDVTSRPSTIVNVACIRSDISHLATRAVTRFILALGRAISIDYFQRR